MEVVTQETTTTTVTQTIVQTTRISGFPISPPDSTTPTPLISFNPIKSALDGVPAKNYFLSAHSLYAVSKHMQTEHG